MARGYGGSRSQREEDVAINDNMKDPYNDQGILYLDSINVNILVRILYYSFA